MDHAILPLHRLELLATSVGTIIRLACDVGGSEVEISPDASLAAGMWLLDASIGRATAAVAFAALMGPSELRLALADTDDGRSVSVLVGDGDDRIILGPVQALMAGEHLIAHGVSAGARLPDVAARVIPVEALAAQ